MSAPALLSEHARPEMEMPVPQYVNRTFPNRPSARIDDGPAGTSKGPALLISRIMKSAKITGLHNRMDHLTIHPI